MHESLDDERRHRKERLAGAIRLFGRFGFEDGVSGHITARDPEYSNCFWVNPFGIPFKQVTVSDLVMANQDGQVIEGRYHINQAAFTVHAQVHAARPDVVAVAHCHSVHGRAPRKRNRCEYGRSSPLLSVTAESRPFSPCSAAISLRSRMTTPYRSSSWMR
jgi:ribulose-5-phosphate 4-epimerase/fuculose-1-phosphate aldolase